MSWQFCGERAHAHNRLWWKWREIKMEFLWGLFCGMSNSRLSCNWPVQSSGCLTSYFLTFIKCAGPGPGSYDHTSATGSFDHMLKLPKIKSKLASVKSKAQRLSLAHTVTDRLAKCRVQWKFVHCSHCMRPSLGDQALNKCRIHCERQTALYSHAF